eukprot:Sspe_Gene.21853::Locus_8224_Transcript_1_1_Confidence_1.000_Length_1274::g.21853::m.21853
MSLWCTHAALYRIPTRGVLEHYQWPAPDALDLYNLCWTDGRCASHLLALYETSVRGQVLSHEAKAVLSREMANLRARACDIGPKTHTLYLSILVHYRQMRDAQVVFSTMHREFGVPSPAAHLHMLRGYARNGDVAGFLEIANSMHREGYEVCETLLWCVVRLCRARGHTSLVRTIVEAEQCPPDSLVAEAVRAMPCVSAAFTFVHHLAVAPGEATWNAFLALAAERGGDPGEVLSIVDKMEAGGVPPSPLHLMRAYVACGLPVRALSVLTAHLPPPYELAVPAMEACRLIASNAARQLADELHRQHNDHHTAALLLRVYGRTASASDVQGLYASVPKPSAPLRQAYVSALREIRLRSLGGPSSLPPPPPPQHIQCAARAIQSILK